MTGRTLIVAALPEEMRPLLARIEVHERERVAGCGVVRGALGSHPVELAVTGAGRAAAQRTATALLANENARRLLVIGVSGGLSPELARGALLVGRRVVHAGEDAPPPDPAWLEAAVRVGAQPATFVTADEVLCTPKAKAEAWHALGQPVPAAVDMETAAFAAAAAAAGVPWLAVRAVSDVANETLPLDFNRFRDAQGRLRRGRILGHALLHPGATVRLLRLRATVARCAERLAVVACALHQERH